MDTIQLYLLNKGENEIYLVVYDISDPKRLRKVALLCEKYLNRIQKSVFEGDLTKSQLFALKKDLKRAINKHVDSVLIYFMQSTSMKKKIMLGREMDDPYLIL